MDTSTLHNSTPLHKNDELRNCKQPLHTRPDPDDHQPNCKRLEVDPIIPQNNVCQHLKFVFKVCASCGQTMDKAVFEKLLLEKKLSLVLDIDNTLLHSVLFDNLSREEQELVINQTDPTSSSFRESLFRTEISGKVRVIKLRPGLRRFLDEASKLFSLHVYTKGTFVYVLEMLNLIDPGRVYFDCETRIFTRESIDYPCDQKSLDLVIGEASGILIVDDLKRVWREKDEDNLIVIPGYRFFGDDHEKRDGCETSSQLAVGTDESEFDGHLSLVLELLKTIHYMFFNTGVEGNLKDRDVRKLKIDLREELRMNLQK